MKRLLLIILTSAVGLFIGTRSLAQENKKPGADDVSVGNTTESQTINAFMVGKIIGSKVINMKGDALGRIDDLVIDIDTGQIVYAVLESGGILGVGEKLFPVPWKSLAALPSEGIFFLNKSKEQMKLAPAFVKKDLPNMGDMKWGADVFKYYGAPAGYAQRAPLGYDYGSYGYYGFDYLTTSPGSGIASNSQTGDPYKKLFDRKTIKTISGQVIRIDQVPELGFGMQMRLTVFIDRNEISIVYLGPAFYVLGPRQTQHLKLGDKVTVSGSQVTVGGEPSIIALTVRRADEVLRLRDMNGLPEWIGWKKVNN